MLHPVSCILLQTEILHNYWMDCYEILCRHSWSTEIKCYLILWVSLCFSSSASKRWTRGFEGNVSKTIVLYKIDLVQTCISPPKWFVIMRIIHLSPSLSHNFISNIQIFSNPTFSFLLSCALFLFCVLWRFQRKCFSYLTVRVGVRILSFFFTVVLLCFKLKTSQPSCSVCQ